MEEEVQHKSIADNREQMYPGRLEQDLHRAVLSDLLCIVQAHNESARASSIGCLLQDKIQNSNPCPFPVPIPNISTLTRLYPSLSTLSAFDLTSPLTALCSI